MSKQDLSYEQLQEKAKEDVLYLQLVGVLMKNEVIDKEHINNLWNLEQKYKELLNDN